MTSLSLLDRLAGLDTNTVSDALDFLGLPGATFGLRPLWDCPRIVGRASTIQLCPKHGTAPAVHLISPVIAQIRSDDRLLVIAGGVDGISCWGDILANAAQVKNVRGSVIDGLSRDIEGSESIGYPVYGRGVTMISARNRVVQLSSGEPVTMAGVTVHEDDYIIADRCGTVFVAATCIEQVVALSEQIARRQDGMVQAIRSGRSVKDVMHDKEFEAIRRENVMSNEDRELVALFEGLDTPSVSDAMDKLGLPGQCLGIAPLDNYTKTVVGPAFTVKYVSAGTPPGTVGDFIDDVAEGSFVVIDNDGRTDCTVWGDIMTQCAEARNFAGTVIDGVCRDVSKALGDGYPLFTRGRFMRTGKDRVEVEAVNVAVSIGTARVSPRDIVIADADGVVVVPRDRAREVAETARSIETVEAAIREQISQGKTLEEAREALGYHTLQRKS